MHLLVFYKDIYHNAWSNHQDINFVWKAVMEEIILKILVEMKYGMKIVLKDVGCEGVDGI
jgi:hypothetical protein